MPDHLFDPDAPPTGQVRAHLDAEAGRQARDRAVAAVADHHGAAVTLVLDALAELRLLLDDPDARFTTDEVWVQLGDKAETIAEPRAMGAAMTGARRAGLIAPTDAYRPSARPACHGRPVRVWRWAA